MAKIIGCTWFLQNERKFLMMLRDNKSDIPYPNHWVFPGGTTEGDETPEIASTRELMEEINYKPKSMEKVFILYYPKGVAEEHFYHISLDCKKEDLILGEGQKIELFTLDEIEKLSLGFWCNEALILLKRYLIEKSKKEMEVKELRLYSNGLKDDREIFPLLHQARVPFANFGPVSEEETPLLEYGFWKFHGVKSITKFIEEYWKLGRLPPIKP